MSTINDLRAFFTQHKFDPPAIELDGKIHRFGPKNSQWYVGWQNHSARTGETYIIADIGDWKTGAKYEFRPAKISRVDKKVIDEQIKEARERAAEEKRLRQEEAAQSAERRWADAASDGTHEYLARKLVPELYGCRLMRDQILVPTRDVDGRLWGFQKIAPDGQKRFVGGQRVDGCFHVIGSPIDGEVFLCEGFATGASVYQATKMPTVVAFYAHNLGSVVKELKAKWPTLRITVAGDDDRFNQENAGRDKGEKAARLALGAAIFPKFSSEDGKPTDFNDLHMREGLDAVTAQLGAQPEVEVGFVPLGYQESTYFFYEMRRRDIVKIGSGMTPVQLFQLAPKEYWAERYVAPKGGIDWSTAQNELISMSGAIGQFDTSRIRGSGVWLDDGRIVVNTGGHLVVDGRQTGLTSIRSHHVYVKGINCLPAPWAPLEDARPLLEACSALNWRDRQSGYLLAGWLALARIAGALPVRPHIWLTGGSGTGKSTVMERIISPCLGAANGRIYAQGASTEAGLRQMIKSSSIPVIFDEFESTNDVNKMRIMTIIELLRSSWSATGGSIIKGSAGGFSVDYQLNFAALVSSIRVNLDNDADRSRFSQLELAPHGNDARQWNNLLSHIKHLDVKFGERLFARSCSLVRQIIESSRVFHRHLALQVSQRFGQQVGILLAGYWSLRSDRVVTEDEAIALIDEFDVEDRDQDDTGEHSDQIEALITLCTTMVTIQLEENSKVTNIQNTIGHLVLNGDSQVRAELRKWGLLVKDGCLLIHTRHKTLKDRVWRGTRWETCYAKTLLRLVGAERFKTTKFFTNTTTNRPVSIPLALIRKTEEL